MKPQPTVVCSACPWRMSNQGTRHPHGWYSQKNLLRLWNGLRSGNAPGMTCHPTDPNNVVPEGHRAAPEGAEAVECAGALLLVQRELKHMERLDPKGYKALRGSRGMKRAGLAVWLERVMFGGTPLGGPPVLVVQEDADVGFPWIEAPK